MSTVTINGRVFTVATLPDLDADGLVRYELRCKRTVYTTMRKKNQLDVLFCITPACNLPGVWLHESAGTLRQIVA